MHVGTRYEYMSIYKKINTCRTLKQYIYIYIKYMWCHHTENSMDVSLHTMGFPDRLLLSSHICRCKQHFLYYGLCKSYMTALHRWCEHIVPNTYLYCRVYAQAYNQRIYIHTKTYFGSSPSIVKQPSGAVMHNQTRLCDTDDAAILQHIMQYPFHIAQWTGSSLVQVMACRLFGARPLPEPMLVYCPLDSWEKVSVKFEVEFYHFN